MKVSIGDPAKVLLDDLAPGDLFSWHPNTGDPDQLFLRTTGSALYVRLSAVSAPAYSDTEARRMCLVICQGRLKVEL